MATELYARLTYDEYKRLEQQLKDFASLETTHESAGKGDQFYHNSFRINLGDIVLEIHGPLVKP